MQALRDALGRRYDLLRERARRGGERVDGLLVGGAAHVYRGADALVARAFDDERPDLASGDLTGVLDDLVAYTQLPREAVEQLVMRREPQSFRSEWHSTPPQLRHDHWFYLSSKAYLFGNAIHFADPTLVDLVDRLLPREARVLEFGGGVGSLAFALAQRGHRVWVDELSALQRDFVRFRVHRHGLADRVSVLEPWTVPATDAFDAVTAFDVFEHLPEGRSVVARRLSALRGQPVRPEPGQPHASRRLGTDRAAHRRGPRTARERGEPPRLGTRRSLVGCADACGSTARSSTATT
jgi:hypothetical protein